MGTLHFQKRVERNIPRPRTKQDLSVRRSRSYEGQIPQRCISVTTMRIKNPTDCLSLGFTQSCCRNRHYDWHLLVPKPSSRKVGATLFPPLYPGLCFRTCWVTSKPSFPLTLSLMLFISLSIHLIRPNLYHLISAKFPTSTPHIQDYS